MSAKLLSPEQVIAYKALNIRTYDTPEGITGDRIIISLDGGGIRGILTIQLLKKVEEIAGIPCHSFCDLVAGTSTGAIIAGLMTDGRTAAEIESLYIKFVTRVFIKRSLLSDQAIDPPKYTKQHYRSDLKDALGDKTLVDACKNSNLDLLISAKDIVNNEETFFTCFQNDGWQGTYKDALLRMVMEATMSAPTYFTSLDRFVDGGTTVYNNPSLPALMEALEYNGKDKYDADKITMFSFGTGRSSLRVTVADAAKPKGLSILFWFNYIVKTSSQDANAMQSDLFRSRIFKDVDYRRFQVSLDTTAIGKMPDRDLSALHGYAGRSLHTLTDKDINAINLDDVDKFDLMKELGLAMVDYIMTANGFRDDLNNTPTHRDELVTHYGNVNDILTNVASPQWLDTNDC